MGDETDFIEQPAPRAEQEKLKALLTRIAEINGPIECTSLRDWREKVKKMAAKALKGMK